MSESPEFDAAQAARESNSTAAAPTTEPPESDPDAVDTLAPPYGWR
jgi:hypothetical protein